MTKNRFGYAVVLLSGLLIFVSAGIVPSASKGDPFRLSGVRIVDLLAVTSVVLLPIPAFRAPLRRTHIARSTSVLAFVSALWFLWTLIPTLSAGIAPRAMIAELQFPTYLMAAWFALVLIGPANLPTLLHWFVVLNLPLTALFVGLSFVRASEIGADLATLACVVALLARGSKRLRPEVASVALVIAIVACVFSYQRAALVMSIPALLIGYMVPSRRRWHPLSVAFACLSLAGALLAAMLAGSAGGNAGRFSSWYYHVFLRPAQELSSQSRVVQFDTAWQQIRDSPLLGTGGGTQIVYFDPGIGAEVVSNITHNSVVDLALRFGVPIAALFTVLFAIIMIRALRTAVRRSDSLLWCLAWAALSIAMKGMLESVLFKPRLSYVLALLIGAVIMVLAESQREAETGTETVDRGVNPSKLQFDHLLRHERGSCFLSPWSGTA